MLFVLLACNSGELATPEVSEDSAALECSADDLGELYERYIEPLMTEAHPSTCNQCHLSGIDLTMFVRDTPCESMACMIEQNLVNLDSPEDSAVLSFIDQASPDSELITEEVIAREHDGFLEWIQWSATCHDDVCADATCPPAGDGKVTLPDGIQTPLGGCEEDTIAAAFQDQVWSWHGRCWTCHYSGGDGYAKGGGAAPPFFVSTGDEAESSRLTMYNLIGLGAIDIDDPVSSLLLTKPMAEGVTVSTDIGDIVGIWHGGSDKFEDGEDETLHDFFSWIVSYAECRAE